MKDADAGSEHGAAPTPAADAVAGSVAAPSGGDFRERLAVPLSWWLIAGFFLLSFLVAVAFYLGPWWGIAATLAVGIPVVWTLAAYGSARITADDRAITVDGFRLEWEWVESVRPLDAGQTRRLFGPEADARALLVLRPYLRESVQIVLDDPADPHPYWLVSTRRGAELADVARARLTGTVAQSTGD